MFTGLVEEIGRIVSLESRGKDLCLWIAAERVLDDAVVGASVAIDGCCLTVVELAEGRLLVEAVPETLERTTLGERRDGDAVNLERALRLDQRLGGHLVQGHVDGTGRVSRIADEGGGRRITFELPGGLLRFVAEKGSLAIDGVSLTVAACTGDTCEIAYIPHTLAMTTAGSYRVGERVNLEVDLMARYAARLLGPARDTGVPT
jgi:riboflavin synthase